jgi:hypothetical protein
LLAQALGTALFDAGVALNWLLFPAALVLATGVTTIGTWMAVRRAIRKTPAQVLQEA